MSKLGISLGLLVCAAAAGCGSSRTAAATQSTIKAFDAGKSDPKAVAIADQVMQAVGGEANWAKAKEIIFTQGIIIDGKLGDVAKHAWDRWEGRHQYTKLYGDGMRAVSMYEMFGSASFAFLEGEKGRSMQMKQDKEKLVAEAKQRFDSDTYLLFMPFKLKDPGVKLQFSEERRAMDAKTTDDPFIYDVIKITFEPGVGTGAGDTWYLVVEKATHMPAWIEHVAAGKDDNVRSGALLQDWVEAGGLKFASKRVTLGYTKLEGPKVLLSMPPAWAGMVPFEPMQVPEKGEIILIKNVKVNASPTEDLYVPNVLENLKM